MNKGRQIKKMHLTDEHFIESDSRQYILKKIRMNEDSEVYERVLGYYGTIRQLVRGLVEKEIKSARIEDFNSLISHLDDLEDRITKTLHEIGVPELLSENKNNFKYIGQLERENKRLEKELEELKHEHIN